MAEPPTQPQAVPLLGPPTLRAQLPNALSAARLAATAAFIAILSLGASPAFLYTAAAVFVAAAITDALDGFLARRWNAISVLGRVLDPLADKALVLAAFVLLAGPQFKTPEPTGTFITTTQLSGTLPWMTALILIRELLVTTLRSALESRGLDFSASTTGKLKMIAQSVAVPTILVIAATADANPAAASINTLIALATTLITAASAVPYLTRALTLFRSEPSAP